MSVDEPVIARKGNLVQIHVVALEAGERATSLPEATRAVPYEGWLKGFLVDDEARIGDIVRIVTFIGRQTTGALAAVNPRYDHNFGESLLELESIGLEAWQLLEGGATP